MREPIFQYQDWFGPPVTDATPAAPDNSGILGVYPPSVGRKALHAGAMQASAAPVSPIVSAVAPTGVASFGYFPAAPGRRFIRTSAMQMVTAPVAPPSVTPPPATVARGGRMLSGGRAGRRRMVASGMTGVSSYPLLPGPPPEPPEPPGPGGPFWAPPADRGTLWSAAARGTLPTIAQRPVFITLTPSGGNDLPQVLAAIAACPANRTIAFSAGTFLFNELATIDKDNISLIGAGRNLTLLKKTNGSVYGSNTTGANVAPIFVVGKNRFGGHDESTAVNLTSAGVKGNFTVTVANTAPFAVGTFVLLDRNDYDDSTFQSLPARNGGPSPYTQYMNSEIVWKRHNPVLSGLDDPFPDSLTWYSRSKRSVAEMKKIASIAGNTITFTTPLHIAYPMSKVPQLTRFTTYAHVRGVGIESMAFQGGSDSNIRFIAAAESWVKDCDLYHWHGECVHAHESFQVKILDSYLHDASYASPCGGAYAISLSNGTSEILIENNIICYANKMMVARSAGAGSVVAYNHTDNGFIIYAPTFCEVGVNGSHLTGGHHMLFEGNYSFNYDCDNTHGSAPYMTVFRNHLYGNRTNYAEFSAIAVTLGLMSPAQKATYDARQCDASDRCVGLNFGSWFHTIAGNVLGRSGGHTGWTYMNIGGGPNTGDYFGIVDGGPGDIFKLGYQASEWEQDVDPKCKPTTLGGTTLLVGNYDFLQNQQSDLTPLVGLTLPDSLYLSAKPAFFGALAWPWVNPATGARTTLPAKQLYDTVYLPLGHTIGYLP